jgi:DNA-binding transcriptional regulator LsrR (DeoR family)
MTDPQRAHGHLAIVGIGQMDESATLFRGGHVSPTDWDRLVAAGAAGNVNTCFFDDAGRALPDLQVRTIAISLEDLRAIDTVVAVAGGAAKVRAIRGALATGAIDVLVTDEATATAVLDAGNDGSTVDAGRPAPATSTRAARRRTQDDRAGRGRPERGEP